MTCGGSSQSHNTDSCCVRVRACACVCVRARRDCRSVDRPIDCIIIIRHLLLNDEAVFRHAREAFGVFDRDGKGHIVREDLRRVAAHAGQEIISDAEMDNILACVDRVGCGVISEEDFTRALENCSKWLLDKNYELS